MSTCTWVDCTTVAEHPQIAADGRVWANLCTLHDGDLQRVVKGGPIPKVLGVWVKASGGAKKLASTF